MLAPPAGLRPSMAARNNSTIGLYSAQQRLGPPKGAVAALAVLPAGQWASNCRLGASPYTPCSRQLSCSADGLLLIAAAGNDAHLPHPLQVPARRAVGRRSPRSLSSTQQ